ncbi:chemotaxis protein CheW [hot springs metagenome]|uniref:Chemotaxis protein CheW n=1 Tax=hot springs metagenome TaxID=433727 RepID=A0A5J4KZ66_9ZZZZ
MEELRNKSDIILDELKRRSSKREIVDVDEAIVKIVVFLLQNSYYGFYGEDVKEILHVPEICYVPATADFVMGVINLRGDIEAVLSINKFLGLPDSETSLSSRIAIIQKNAVRAGVLVDAVEDVLDIPTSSTKQPLSTLNNAVKEYVVGEIIYRDKSVTILDVEKIFLKIMQ